MFKVARTLLVVVALAGFLDSISTIAESDGMQDGFSGQSTSNHSHSSGKTKYVNDFVLLTSWADEDVPYIITPGERLIFAKLASNEERMEFIEQFWLRRDPTPDTARNEFKEEHYRRIAYANEHFGTSVPGWKSDRGRVYIILGAPDSLTSHDDCEDSTGKTKQGQDHLIDCPLFDVWRYNYVEFTGPNVVFEFVDRSGSGDYKLTKDTTDKTPMYFNPCCDDGSVLTTVPPPPKSREWFLSRFEQPPLRFPDLNALVTARIKRDQLAFGFRFDSVRAASHTNIVQISLNIPNHEISLQDEHAIPNARINLYGRISTIGGRVVDVIEDSIPLTGPEASENPPHNDSSFYQYSIPLSPGLYRLDLAVKDALSGRTGIKSALLRVPRFKVDRLDASLPITADQVEVATKSVRSFMELRLGAYQVRPRVNSEFIVAEELHTFMQVYNLRVSREANSPAASIRYRITRLNSNQPKTIESVERLAVTSEQLTIHHSIPLSSLQAGSYKLTIEVTDELAHQTISRSADFTVIAARP